MITFSEGPGPNVPVILSPLRLAERVGVSVKTIYHWTKSGRLDGAYRKRGMRMLIWRNRAINLLFNGSDWNDK